MFLLRMRAPLPQIEKDAFRVLVDRPVSGLGIRAHADGKRSASLYPAPKLPLAELDLPSADQEFQKLYAPPPETTLLVEGPSEEDFDIQPIV